MNSESSKTENLHNQFPPSYPAAPPLQPYYQTGSPHGEAGLAFSKPVSPAPSQTANEAQ